MATFAQRDAFHEVALAGLSLPITLHPPVPMSDAELMIFSQRNRPYRIERNAKGDLEIMTPVGGDGSRWEAFVIRELGLWAEEHGGAYFSSNGGFSLPDGSMLSPDAAWVSDARWNALNREQRRSFPPLCPEFVIEILSATDSRKTLEDKMQRWIANGARLAWMVDPYAATLSIYRPDSEPQVLDRPDSVEAAEVVPGFRLTTRNLWAI